MSEQRQIDPAVIQPSEERDDITAGLSELLSDLAAPQERWVEMGAGGYLPVFPGLGVSFDRRDTQFITRSNDVFSMCVDVNLGNVRPLVPLNVDPPLHAKFRKLLTPLFSRSQIVKQDNDFRTRANAFIDTFIDRGECHFTDEFANLYPAAVFLGLLGLPEDELAMFLQLRDGILHPELTDPAAGTDMAARGRVVSETGQRIYDYFGSLIEERTHRPADDIITLLLSSEIDGDRLTPEEIEDVCYLLIIAGLDTVGDALTCSFAFLAQNPEHRHMIVANPDIIPAAIEELLRWESPAPSGSPRLAKCPVELPSGAQIAKGSLVSPHWGAANMDPAVFGDPLAVRFDRDSNPHIAFGAGIHTCIGAHLARQELRITLEEWHRRIPEYGIKPGHEELEYPVGLRHVKNLMLAWPAS
jgi:cytochrome P450